MSSLKGCLAGAGFGRCLSFVPEPRSTSGRPLFPVFVMRIVIERHEFQEQSRLGLGQLHFVGVGLAIQMMLLEVALSLTWCRTPGQTSAEMWASG